MSTPITTHPRTEDQGKPRIFRIGGNTGGFLSETQTVLRGHHYTCRCRQPLLYPFPVSHPLSNAIVSSLIKQNDFFYHLVEATPRLMKAIACKTWKYIRLKGVNLYLIGNAISGKTRKSCRYTDNGPIIITGLNPALTDASVLKLHSATTRLVWMFTHLVSTGFQTKLFVWRAGLSSFSHDKSNRLIIARLKGCAQ